jgi:hypothetical protein
VNLASFFNRSIGANALIFPQQVKNKPPQKFNFPRNFCMSFLHCDGYTLLMDSIFVGSILKTY